VDGAVGAGLSRWLNDGSCIRLRAERPNHVWSYDFLEERTHDGGKIRARRWLNDGLTRSLSESINFVAKMAQFPIV